ncbi:hypothetical protein AGOR_G00105990 [Albula goreensis]|uniref:Chromogranin-A n=1 Tax=Albula goreensis TaxID=1534307 RepID=A0A8T3DD81_9TELE|nr:hypothetical protein AGOR_G00105990 [Albula goreensis]
MITRGCYIFTLLVSYVLSVPVPIDQEDKDDVKVMKCIVEVIADTLTKPHPIGISQECQDSLTGDERIVSILRHQNLLKELQEIAAQGVSERTHQQPQKKSEEEGDQITDALGGHPSVEDTTEQSTLREEPTESKGAGEEDNEVEEESREKDEESREGNEIGGTNEGEGKEKEEEEAGENAAENPGNHISDSLNQEGEEQEEEQEAPVEEEGRHSSSEEDEEKGKEGNETEEEENAQVNKGGESELLKDSSEVRSEERDADDMQGEPENKKPIESVEVEKGGEEKETEVTKVDKENGPDFQQWSKEDKVSPMKPFEAAEEDEPLGNEERNQMEVERGSPQLLQYTLHHSKEDSEERRSPEARGEMEEKREEEGSASQRVEDHEIERLAAIESELESVAQRLHELRRG